MSETITVSYPFTAEMFLPAFKWNHRLLRLSSKVVLGITVVMTVLGVVALLSPSKELPISPVFVAPPFGMMLVAALLPRLGRAHYTAAMRRSRSHGQPLTFHVSENGVKIDAPDRKSELHWSAFYRSLITPDRVLLYQNSRSFNWLPKAAFANDADYSRVLALTAAKTKNSRIG